MAAGGGGRRSRRPRSRSRHVSGCSLLRSAPACGCEQLPIGTSTWAEQAIAELLRILPEHAHDDDALDSIAVAEPVVRRAVNDLVHSQNGAFLDVSLSLERPSGSPITGHSSAEQARVLRSTLDLPRRRRPGRAGVPDVAVGVSGSLVGGQDVVRGRFPDEGLGVAVAVRGPDGDASVRSATLVNRPRRSRLSVSSFNHRSTRFSHELEVGVKCRCQRRRSIMNFRVAASFASSGGPRAPRR